MKIQDLTTDTITDYIGMILDASTADNNLTDKDLMTLAFQAIQIDRMGRLIEVLSHLGFSAPDGAPGAFEFIGMQMRNISQSLTEIADAIRETKAD